MRLLERDAASLPDTLLVAVEIDRRQQHQSLDDVLPVDPDAEDRQRLFITPMTKAPITTPTPPEAKAPSMKQAAMTSSSKELPALGVAEFNRAAPGDAPAVPVPVP